MLQSAYYQDDEFLACFHGDLVDPDHLPWHSILTNIKDSRFKFLNEFRGYFTAIIFQKKDKCVFLISDRTSQQPVYYFFHKETVFISSSQATFCRLLQTPNFNFDWLHEFFFFNFPVTDTSILKDVQRMPAASVWTYNLQTSTTATYQYAEVFKTSSKIVKGNQGIEMARQVFKSRMPKYYGINQKVASPLTAGLDTRTLLAFASPSQHHNIQTYTYGQPGSTDLLQSAIVSKQLKLPHLEIHLDDTFISNIRKLIYETVYLSGGLENVKRCILPYVYRELTENTTPVSFIMSGVSGGHLFRGQANIPNMISR
jgi:asparagine synthetase B (glutamine-hydrolysing)